MSFQLALVVGAVCYLAHLACETLASFVKYNYAAIGRHMHGVATSNIIAVASRGFVAVYGVLVSYVVESEIDLSWEYGVLLSLALMIASGLSLALSRFGLVDGGERFGLTSHRSLAFIEQVGSRAESDVELGIHINLLMSMFLGIQFVAVAIAYALCFKAPQHRLLIISMVPVLSMLGTIVTVAMVEPRFAKKIDNSKSLSYQVSRVFMRARAASFAVSALFLFMFVMVSEKI